MLWRVGKETWCQSHFPDGACTKAVGASPDSNGSYLDAICNLLY